MKIDWESENMAWAFYLSLSREGFFFVLMLAGVDIAFHILYMRDIVYPRGNNDV